MGGMQTHPTRYPTDVTDEEWEHIESLVPAPKSGKGKRGRPVKLERRALANAIFYTVRSGCAWRLLPSDFGPWQTVYGYFRQWSQDWTWRFIHDALRDCLRKTEDRKVAPTAAIIDMVPVMRKAPERGQIGPASLVCSQLHQKNENSRNGGHWERIAGWRTQGPKRPQGRMGLAQ
jgi:transposase